MTAHAHRKGRQKSSSPGPRVARGCVEGREVGVLMDAPRPRRESPPRDGAGGAAALSIDDDGFPIAAAARRGREPAVRQGRSSAFRFDAASRVGTLDAGDTPLLPPAGKGSCPAGGGSPRRSSTRAIEFSAHNRFMPERGAAPPEETYFVAPQYHAGDRAARGAPGGADGTRAGDSREDADRRRHTDLSAGARVRAARYAAPSPEDSWLARGGQNFSDPQPYDGGDLFDEHQPLEGEVADCDSAVSNQAVCERVCTGYLLGQVANVAKAGVWWSTFGVVAEALTSVHIAVGLTRLAFNVALVLISPVAAVVSEAHGVKAILRGTTQGRLVMWCAVIPAAWFACRVLRLTDVPTFAALFSALIFVDGAFVSFANVVDVDCGGLDSLAAEYDLAVSPDLRDRYNRLHQAVFDFSFIALTPPLALAIFLGAKYLMHDFPACQQSGFFGNILAPFCRTENLDVAVLLVGICLIFGLLSVYSLRCYEKNLATITVAERAQERAAPAPSYWQVSKERFCDFVEGCKIVLQEQPLKWRLIFLAFETAFEDAVVSVVIPQTALAMAPLLYSLYSNPHTPAAVNIRLSAIPGGWTFVNAVAVALIAAGKLGGKSASLIMSRSWEAASQFSLELLGTYRRLFTFELWSLLFISAYPLAYFIAVANFDDWDFCPAKFNRVLNSQRLMIVITVLVVASFLYFALATCPKVGFAGLLHAIVLQSGVDSRVFSFVGTFVTLVDAFVIVGVSAIFAFAPSCRVALCATAVVYALFGAAEVAIGPRVILFPVAEHVAQAHQVRGINMPGAEYRL